MDTIICTATDGIDIHNLSVPQYLDLTTFTINLLTSLIPIFVILGVFCSFIRNIV